MKTMMAYTPGVSGRNSKVGIRMLGATTSSLSPLQAEDEALQNQASRNDEAILFYNCRANHREGKVYSDSRIILFKNTTAAHEISEKK